MTARQTTHLRREQVAHLVRAAAAITTESTFVLIGTGAAVAQLKSVPPDLAATRTLDLYAPGAADAAAVSRLMDGTIGEGTAFDRFFGYHARVVGQDAAILPYDWRLRARPVSLRAAPGTTCICPDLGDVALDKLCAWTENDRRWLEAAWRAGLLGADALRERAKAISDPRAPGATDIEWRISALEAGLPPSGAQPAKSSTDGLTPPDVAGDGQG